MDEITMEMEQAEELPSEISAEEKLSEAVRRADMLESQLKCSRLGVPEELSADVIHLAEKCGGIEAVLEKYPFFRGNTEKSRGITTGVHLDMAAHDEPSGVEAAFRRANPNVKF